MASSARALRTSRRLTALSKTNYEWKALKKQGEIPKDSQIFQVFYACKGLTLGLFSVPASQFHGEWVKPHWANLEGIGVEFLE